MRGQQAEPKPFVLVPIPKEEPEKCKGETFEQFKDLTGQLELEFEVVSHYLFVGSGGYDFDPKAKGDRPDVWHTFHRRNGQICVPGTSLKGSIRAILEAISNSCVSQIRKGEQLSSHKRCEFKKVDQSQLCPACRLFGTTGLRGRLSFSDAFPIGNVNLSKVKIAELWEPRLHKNARRFYEVKTFQGFTNQQPERNHRFVEAAPKGAKFKTVFHFENLNKSELGLVFHALGWRNEGGLKFAFTPKIGGAKPRCFGAVMFRAKRLKLWLASDFSSLLEPKVKEGESLAKFIGDCLNRCQESEILHKDSWREFVNKMKPKNDPCPRGNY